MKFGSFTLAQPLFDDGNPGGSPAAAEPVTTESLVASAAAGLEGSESQTADPDATADPAEEEVVAEEPAGTPAEVDALAAELGLKPGQRDNRIPYSRVKGIVAKAEEKHAAALAEHVAKVQKYEEERTAYSAQLEALRVAEENPEAFLKAIAEADPRYAKLLAREAAASQQAAPVDRPQPDVLNPDGSLGYSPEGFERLADWKAEQRVKALDARYAERLAPIEHERAVQAHIQAAVPRAQAAIDEALTWPMFRENQDAIVAAMTADRALSLDGAYRKVVFPKISSSRDTMRAEILAEINKKPAAAAKVVPGAAPAVSAGPRTTEDVVRDAVAAMKSR